MSVLENNVLFTLKFSVARESHPVTELVSEAVWLPPTAKLKPFQV